MAKKKEIKMMVVHYKDGEEKGHHEVSSLALENHVKFYTEYGYECKAMTIAEYNEWRKEDAIHN